MGIIGGNLPRHALTQMARRKINKELVEHVIKQAEQARVMGTLQYLKATAFELM